MKYLAIILPIFFASLASASALSCGIAGVDHIVERTQSHIFVRPLSVVELDLIRDYVDFEESCNEGVDILGFIQSPTGAEMNITCWEDSLGGHTFSIPLICN